MGAECLGLILKVADTFTDHANTGSPHGPESREALDFVQIFRSKHQEIGKFAINFQTKLK